MICSSSTSILYARWICPASGPSFGPISQSACSNWTMTDHDDSVPLCFLFPSSRYLTLAGSHLLSSLVLVTAIFRTRITFGVSISAARVTRSTSYRHASRPCARHERSAPARRCLPSHRLLLAPPSSGSSSTAIPDITTESAPSHLQWHLEQPSQSCQLAASSHLV